MGITLDCKPGHLLCMDRVGPKEEVKIESRLVVQNPGRKEILQQ